MSNQIEERRKLRPKRFNKFEKSEYVNISHRNNETKRGIKRPSEDLKCFSNNKQKCYGLMHPSGSTVNLANNRLQKLKQNLQSDLKNKDIEANSSSGNQSTVKNNCLTKSTNLVLNNIPVNSEASPNSGKNIYQNLHKWANPVPITTKNSANQRLNKLKKVINDDINNGSPKFSDSSGKYNPELSIPISPKVQNESISHKTSILYNSVTSTQDIEGDSRKHISPLLKKSKRKIMNSLVSNKINKTLGNKSKIDDFLKIRSELKDNILVTKLDPEKPNQSAHWSPRILKIKEKIEGISNSVTNFLSPIFQKTENFNNVKSNISPFCSTATQSQTCLSDSIPLSAVINTDIKNTYSLNKSPVVFKEKISSQKKILPENCHKYPSTSKSFKLNRSNLFSSGTIEDSKNVDSFNFKVPSVTTPTHESLSSLNNILLPESDNFTEKMAMTESWIRNHLFTKNFSNVPEVIQAGTSNNIISHNFSKSLADTEEMEWTNAEPTCNEFEDGDNLENKSVPAVPVQQVNLVLTPNKSELNKIHGKTEDKNKCLCIVVDTNIFISELSKLTDIINLKVTGPTQPLLYIPWMVVTELDEMKDRSGDSGIKQKAFNAIKFINKTLSEENPRVKGQTVADMSTQDHIGISPDDKIIGCCLQALKKYETVILFSNDINLKNKAMINNIPAASANEIIMKIMSKFGKNIKSQKILQKMSMLCSEVIYECAKEAYGDAVTKMEILANPPWSLLECLKRFKKYWNAVFQEKLLKHFMSAVDKLMRLISSDTNICDDSEKYVQLVKLCLDLCIFLKDIEDYRGSVEIVINEIVKLG